MGDTIDFAVLIRNPFIVIHFSFISFSSISIIHIEPQAIILKQKVCNKQIIALM